MWPNGSTPAPCADRACSARAEPLYPAGGTPIYARPFHEAFDLPSAEVADPEAAVARAQAQIDDGTDGLKLFTGAIVGEAETALMAPEIVRAVTDLAGAAGVPTFAHPTDAAGRVGRRTTAWASSPTRR